MNLHQQTNSTEGKTQGKAWYQQPETTQPVPPVQQAPLPAPEPQALFEPSAAERILARAGALQEVHGQLLSREQIEAVASEIGIQPEFVQLAIEQEKQEKADALASQQHSTPPTSVPVVAVTVPMTRRARRENVVLNVVMPAGVTSGYGVTAALVLLFYGPYPPAHVLIFFLVVLPGLLALILGGKARSRRWGAGAGAAMGFAAFAALAILVGLTSAGQPRAFDGALSPLALMVGSGALLGAAGAQVRRVVSKRRARNRSRRTANGERVPF